MSFESVINFIATREGNTALNDIIQGSLQRMEMKYQQQEMQQQVEKTQETDSATTPSPSQDTPSPSQISDSPQRIDPEEPPTVTLLTGDERPTTAAPATRNGKVPDDVTPSSMSQTDTSPQPPPPLSVEHNNDETVLETPDQPSDLPSESPPLSAPKCGLKKIKCNNHRWKLMRDEMKEKETKRKPPPNSALKRVTVGNVGKKGDVTPQPQREPLRRVKVNFDDDVNSSPDVFSFNVPKQ